MENLDQLLERCRSGDEVAWTMLVRRFGGLVYAVARRAGASEDLCDDIAQAVFAALVANLGSVRHAAALPAWLRTTAQRETVRQARRRARDAGRPLAEDPPAEPSAPTLDLLEQHQRLRLALDALGGRCRDLLRELYFRPSPPTYEQVALSLSMPIGSIGPTRLRCLAQLARILEVATTK